MMHLQVYNFIIKEDDTEFPESNADWGELVDDENAMPDDLLTEIDNPDYLNFVRSVAAPNNDEMFLNGTF